MLGFHVVFFHLAAHARAADPIDVDAAKTRQSRLVYSTPIETANKIIKGSEPERREGRDVPLRRIRVLRRFLQRAASGPHLAMCSRLRSCATAGLAKKASRSVQADESRQGAGPSQGSDGAYAGNGST